MFRFPMIVLFSLLLAPGYAQSDLQNISLFLDQHKTTLGLSSQDLAEYKILNAYTSDHLNITHVYIEQRYRDIRVLNGILNLNLKGDRLVSFGNRWIPAIYERAPSHLPSVTAAIAVVRSASHLGNAFPKPIKLRREQNNNAQDVKVIYAKGNLSREDIEAELVWYKGEQKNFLLCWKVQIHEIHNENIWDIFIDAHTGAFVRKDNLVLHCSFDKPHHEIHQSKRKIDIASADESIISLAPDSSYNVFALPVESPIHGTRSLVVAPWSLAGPGNPAITLKWHNNGTTNFTSTRGNNVHAYEDIDANNVPGFSPDTFNLRFDYPFTPSIDPTDHLSASITNLFYWNNIIHDVMYQYGFNEVSGNFQNNNLGRGGIGNDYVKAEAQDGAGTNNANFSITADGTSGRMQMYLWDPVLETSPLTINTPVSIAGSMFAIESAFSTANKLEDIGLTTGDLVLVEDAGGMTHEACSTITNNLTGKIAVIDRGNCDFTVKVKNAQNKGAIAAIVVNNVPGAPIAMGGSDNSIVIPAVMISLVHGTTLKTVMNTSTVNVSLDSVPLITPDGDFDNGIIAHEYGHGISTRLTGGPATPTCLNNEEQMGEGWSDFFGLMLTTDWSTASATDPRGIGNYVIGTGTDGIGIRTYPYTVDTSQNPFTYADVANAPLFNGNPSVHYIGSVWATMLWDMTWNIIAMEGIDTDIYDGDGGNNIALQLVIDGLKLQPCNPGFVDGRDAILLADELYYGGQYRCAIWNAFAGRGLGVDADQGSSNDYNDGVESFIVPDGVIIESTTDVDTAGEGQEVTFNLKTTCECKGRSNLSVTDVLSNNLIYIPGSGGMQSANTINFSIDTLPPMDSVQFSYHAFVSPCSATPTTALNTENVEGTAQYVSIKLSGNGQKVWVKSTNLAVSPTHSWYAQDYTMSADFVLKLINPVATSGGPVEIGFYHRYNTEATYDGGVVEYSTNGGTTWIDAGPYFIEHGYPSSITTATTSSIAGRPAFTGNSDTQFSTTGFVHSTIRLALSGPQSLLIRFRMVCDPSVGGTGINGWYIDDIVINQLSGLANKTKVFSNGQLVDSLSYALQTSIFNGDKIYVDPDASGNKSGTSWDHAIHYLPMALGIAGCRSADSILITEGTFLPGLTNNRSQSFTIPDSTSVFGGFPSGGSAFALRDPSINVTVLSGDIGMLNDISDNTYHVIKMDSAQQNSRVDGVTISSGNSNGAGDNSQGAAVFCLGGLTLQNVIMNNNTGHSDGQLVRIRNAAAHLVLNDCTLYSPDDGFVKVLNTNAAKVTVFGNTRIVQE